MAYNNYNDSDVKQVSAVFVDRKNREGKNSKYFSFTVEISGYMYTMRVYADSTYTPTTGKHANKLSCPVRITRWKSQPRGSNKW